MPSLLNVRVANQTSKNVKLAWDAVPGVVGYEFFVDGVRVANTWDPTQLSTTFAIPQDNKQHVFGVTCVGSLDAGLVKIGGPNPTPPPEPPPPVPVPPLAAMGHGRWDIQSYERDPNNSALKAALDATTKPVGYFILTAIGMVPYDIHTPVIDFKTQETQHDVYLPMPVGAKHGPTFDQLLQIFGPNGDVWSIGNDNNSDTAGFGATHILGPDPVTGLYWAEPFGSNQNSTSAGRIFAGWFDADDVKNMRLKTLSFCAPNLAHDPARYPADPAAATNFNKTRADLPTGIPLGSAWRLPVGTSWDETKMSKPEIFIVRCQYKHGEVCRDIGSTKGYYGKSYINTVGDIVGWQDVMSVEEMNGSLPYAHKLGSSEFLRLQNLLECVAGIKP